MFIASAFDLNRFDRDEEVEANAMLIAAAPDLLAAAKAALAYVADQSEEGTSGFIDECEVYRKLAAAIAKVEGGNDE